MKWFLVLLLIGLSLFVIGCPVEDNDVVDPDPIEPDPDPVEPDPDPVDPDPVEPDDPEYTEDILEYLGWFDEHSEAVDNLMDNISNLLDEYDAEDEDWKQEIQTNIDDLYVKIEEGKEFNPHELYEDAYLVYVESLELYEKGLDILQVAIDTDFIDLIFEADLKFDQGDELLIESLKMHLRMFK